MINYLCIGKLVNTHGIKGEVRIQSNFELKEKIFKKDFILYIGEEKKEFIINSYRHHKIYEMVTLKGIDDINQALEYKNKLVYINRDDLNLKEDDYLLDDLISLSIEYNQKIIGKVKEIMYNKSNVLLCIEAEKNFYIPNNSNFIKEVNLKEGKIIVINIEGLII